MKHSSRKIGKSSKKSEILAEYERLKKILEEIHGLTTAFLQPNGQLKSILKKPQPSNDIENSTSMHAIDISCEKDLFGRVKRMSRKSIGTGKPPAATGRPSQSGDNAEDTPNAQQPPPNNQGITPVIRVNCDANCYKPGPGRRGKVKHGRVEQQQQPLRRSSRHLNQPRREDRFRAEYFESLGPKVKVLKRPARL